MGLSTLMALFLWVIATLSQQYTTTLEMPVRVLNIPENIELTQLKTPSIELELEGRGSDLLVTFLQINKDTVLLNFDEVVSDPKLLDNRKFQVELEHLLSDKFALNQVITERVEITYEDKISKKVPLRYIADENLPPSYYLTSEAYLLDDSVSVFGPETQIEDITEWTTKEGFTVTLNQPDTVLIPLEIPAEGLTITPHHARVFLSPKQYTEARLSVPVEISEVPENIEVRLSHQEIQIACLVPMGAYSPIVSSLSKEKIVVPYSTLNGQVPTLVPQLSLPDSIRQVYQQPLSISFVIVEQAP